MLQFFLDDVDRGRIQRNASVSIDYLYRAFRAIVYNKVEPAKALQLAPVDKASAMDMAKRRARERVFDEVLPVWDFFRSALERYLAQSRKRHGSVTAVITQAVTKFAKSTRVIERYYSAYIKYAERLDRKAEEIVAQKDKFSDDGAFRDGLNEIWRHMQNLDKREELPQDRRTKLEEAIPLQHLLVEYTFILDQIANIAFGRAAYRQNVKRRLAAK